MQATGPLSFFIEMNPTFGKYIILAGVVLVLTGTVVYFFGNKLDWPEYLRPGRLPGDIRIEGKNGGGFYFPIVTCIVVSILLNLLIGLIRRFFG
jgi:hypothetical protein